MTEWDEDRCINGFSEKHIWALIFLESKAVCLTVEELLLIMETKILLLLLEPVCPGVSAVLQKTVLKLQFIATNNLSVLRSDSYLV